MTLPELSIKRHVLAWMMSGVLMLFGIIGYKGIGVDRFPSVEIPFITVSTLLPGASPDVVDASVTNIIEAAVNSVPGIDHIQSTSYPSLSVAIISFNLSKNADVAFNEVQTKVNQVLMRLPDDAQTPVVAKMEFGAMPVMWLVLQGDRTLQQLNEYADKVLKKRLETIDGVGEVRIGGQRERTIRVELDTRAMAGYAITSNELVAAFAREHVRLPGGYLVDDRREELLKLDLEFHDLDALRRMVVATRDGAPIRLGDIAKVVDGLEDNRSLARFNGESAVALGIVKVSGANTVAIIDAVKQRLETDILPHLPAGVRIDIAHDDAALILDIIHALQEHLLFGTLLAGLVVWLFLKSLRSTLIVVTAIPVSLLGAVAAMYFAGYTFNILTLLALLLLVGVVVDDAIVVLENIFRHREEGETDPVAAARHGTNQVVFAVLAATLTLVAIFTPVIFMQGIIGRFFESFAVVVVVGVLTSWFVAMSLTPMLCSRYLRINPKRGAVVRSLDRAFGLLDRTYTALLRTALRFRWSVVLIAVVTMLASFSLFGKLGGGFMPEQDEGRFMITFKTPLGSSIDYAGDRLAAIEAILATDDAILGYFSTIGASGVSEVHKGNVIVRLRPWSERSITQAEVIARLDRRLRQLPGVVAFAGKIPEMGGGRGEPLQFFVTGDDLAGVARHAEALKARLDDFSAELGEVDLELNLNLPQIETRIDRERVSELGLSALDVATALNILVGGFDVARYNDAGGSGERYDIRLKANEADFSGLPDLSRIELRTASGERVRLDDLVEITPTLGPAQIGRYDLQYAAQFFGTPLIDMQSASQLVEREANALLPDGYQFRLTGEAEEFKKTAGFIAFAFSAAILLVYMVLASQFNSFIQPLILMTAQPLAIIGGVTGLWLTGHGINIYSMIGLVLLMGLVAKNAILLIDLTNQNRARGETIDAALLHACPVRMRPVLMTSLTVILSLLPAALGLGAGADTNGPLAVAVIGGMVSSTLLTLVVVPSVYSLVEHGLQRLRRWFGKGDELDIDPVALHE